MTANFRVLVDADWLVFGRWSVLHHARLTDDQLTELEDLGTARAVWTACSRWARIVSIPGVSTRMFAMRCQQCCDATGCPRGKGSPKNDKACREWLAGRRDA